MSIRTVAIAIVLLQLVDVAIHMATSQFEIVRVIASAFLGGWAFAVLFLDFKETGYTLGRRALVIYLVLNLFFVFENGITNPQLGGQLRILLIGLVLASAYLASMLLKRLQAE